jgi:hypothetical protein
LPLLQRCQGGGSDNGVLFFEHWPPLFQMPKEFHQCK